MATFLDLQTRVLRRVIDAPASVTAEVPTLINEAIRTIEEAHNFKVMEAETAQLVTTTGNHVLAAVPADWKSFRGKPYLVDGNGDTKDLIVAASREAALDAYALSDTNDTGEPRVIIEAEASDDDGTRNFEVYPLPDAVSDWGDGKYRIVVPYWKYLPDLSADGDSNWFTVNAVRYIVDEATAEAFFLDWDMEKGAVWTQKAAGERRKVIHTAKVARLGDLTTLVVHKGANDPKLRA